MEPIRLAGSGVLLRPHRPGDVPAIVEQCRDPLSQRWTKLPAPYDTADAERFVARAAEGWADGTTAAFAVADPATEAYLGTIDLGLDGAGAGEVGYCLHPSARGRGLTVAALGTLADWSLDPAGLGLDVLHWRAMVGNWASRRAAWRVGFRVEGTVRSSLAQRGTRRDAWVASLRRGDPREPATRWLAAAELAAPGLRLRPFRDADAPAVAQACTDPDTRHWLATLPDPYTEATALAFVASREEGHAGGTGVFWCAADARDRCVGSFDLMHVDWSAGSAEIGYWVHPAARGRGVATTAVRLVCAHAFETLGLRRVELCAARSNGASNRVAERAGFRRFGVKRDAEPLGDGSRDDLVCHELLTTG